MKRVLLILFLIPSLVFGQKAVKPNLNKALAAWKEGKLDEAKEIIDLCTTYEKTMNNGDTWYYRGLIYASLDTTSNEAYKGLAPDAFATALESFTKADQMAKDNSEYHITDANGLPVLKTQQITIWANTYLNKGATLYQEDDLDGALTNFEKVQKITPNDTTAYFYAGFVANNLEKYDLALDNFRKYVDKGGTSSDAYAMMINIYNGPKEDKAKGLEVVREAKKKFPDHPDFGKIEIGILIDQGKIDEAKKGLEDAIKKEPDNKVLHFYLGYANSTLNNSEAAVKNYQDALRIDPKYFEAQIFLAKEMYKPAAIIKKEMSTLGISEADKKKKFEMDKVLVEKLKVALPYWEQAERINPGDQEVLDQLYSMYGDLGMDAQVKRVEARYKELGMEN
ncbi:MAG TPA: tetratricopeptide repeat protein [Cyclobacteriaceae bacterium]|nr:tetratricopeptide repeat protein [Cyclobacteriaceae bacterium]